MQHWEVRWYGLWVMTSGKGFWLYSSPILNLINTLINFFQRITAFRDKWKNNGIRNAWMSMCLFKQAVKQGDFKYKCKSIKWWEACKILWSNNLWLREILRKKRMVSLCRRKLLVHWILLQKKTERHWAYIPAEVMLYIHLYWTSRFMKSCSFDSFPLFWFFVLVCK